MSQPLIEYFPYSDRYREPLPNQREAFAILEENESVALELPTGTGKTLIGYVFLKAGEANGEAPLFYITPTKALVDQVRSLHPEVSVAYGRNEHRCLYPEYREDSYSADQVPCSLLKDCPHRVDQETGLTKEPGAEPCPYLREKWEAKRARIVVCTMSFYLFTHLFSKEFERPARLVVDECHRIAQVFRNSLSYEITDWHLSRVIRLLKKIGAEKSADEVQRFLSRMTEIIKRREPETPTLLEDEELSQLIELLYAIDKEALLSAVEDGISKGLIDRVEEREFLNKIQVLIRDLNRYVFSLEYSRFLEERKALGYTYAFWIEEENLPRESHIQYKLVIKAYYVAPLIQKLLGRKTLAMSATIGNPEYFGFETGIKAPEVPFYSLESQFPPENTRVFLPTDVVNLAFSRRPKREPNRTIRRIVRTAKSFAERGYRSLVVVISEEERQKFLRFSKEEGLEAVSYNNGVPAKDAVSRFKRGEGAVLVGTASHYGEGIDLPKQIAPVIFFLRPGYPSPYDPFAQFEERRFTRSRIWGLRQWRAMIQALQVRGRNIRSKTDLGVCFFMSKQFKDFLENSLPKELRSSYVEGSKLDECIREALRLLGDGES